MRLPTPSPFPLMRRFLACLTVLSACYCVGYDRRSEDVDDSGLPCAGTSTLELRLVSSDRAVGSAGILQVRCAGREAWSTLCAWDTWDARDGEVACRQLGFPCLVDAHFEELSQGFYSSSEPEVDGPVTFSKIGCFGTEDSLLECDLVSSEGPCFFPVAIWCGEETNRYNPSVSLCRPEHLCGPHCHATTLDGAIKRTGCHCDKLCLAFQDCCYDYQRSCLQVDSQTTPPPDEMDGVAVEYYRCARTVGSQDAFYLVGVCPADAAETRRIPCEGEPLDGWGFAETTPVYVRKTGAHYKNIYCAVCHGLRPEDVDMWTVELGMGWLTPGDVTRYPVHPPSSALQSPRGCVVGTVIEACDENYSESEEIEQACHDFAALYVNDTQSTDIPEINDRTYYRNPYCALCNGQPVTPVDPCGESCSLCSDVDVWSDCEDDPDSYTHILTIEVLFRFRRLIDPSADTCRINEIYHPGLKACFEVTCTDGYEFKDSRCEPIFPRPTCGTSDPVGSETISYSWSPEFGFYDDCLESVLRMAASVIAHGEFRAPSTDDIAEPHINLLTVESRFVNQIMHAVFNMGTRDWCYVNRIFLYVTKPNNVLDVGLCVNGTIHSSCVFDAFDAAGLGETELVPVVQFWGDTESGLSFTYLIPPVCFNHNLTCTFGVTLGQDEYTLYTTGNKTVLEFIVSKAKLEEGDYVILPDGQAFVCLPSDGNPSPLVRRYISLSLTVLSLVALLATFITYCLLPDLRNFAGRCVMNLVGALFVANLTLPLSGLVAAVSSLCLALAVVAHATWLAAFHWMTVIAFSLVRTFRGLRRPRDSGRAPANRLLPCALFAWGAPGGIVAVFLGLHLCNCTAVSRIYAEGGKCFITDLWVALYAFELPVAVLVLTNTGMFFFCVIKLRMVRTVTRLAFSDERNKQKFSDELKIHVKLGVLMGVTWIFGFLDEVIPGEAIEYVHVILNSAQGVFIFVSFCLTKRVRGLWKRRGKALARRTRVTPADGCKDEAGRQAEDEVS